MKTTIDIPEDVLKEAARHIGAKTKQEAVVTALERFNRRQKLEGLAERLHGALPNVHRLLSFENVSPGSKAMLASF